MIFHIKSPPQAAKPPNQPTTKPTSRPMIINTSVLICAGLSMIFLAWLIIKCFEKAVRYVRVCQLQREINIAEKGADYLVKIIQDGSEEADCVISINNSARFIETLRQCEEEKKELRLVIRSCGGCVESSDVMIEAMFCSKVKISTYVRDYALSAASLLVLASNRIHMDPYSYLAPTDPQITIKLDGQDRTYSSRTLLANPSPTLDRFETLISHRENINTLKKIFSRYKLPRQSFRRLIDLFGSGNHSHHKPIFPHTLKKLGIPIRNIPEDMKNIWELVWVSQ